MDIDIDQNVNFMCLELAIYWLSVGNEFIFIGVVRKIVKYRQFWLWHILGMAGSQTASFQNVSS